MTGTTLQHELRKRGPFESPEQEAYLNIQRSAATLSVPFERLFRSRGLTVASYNALRILRGAGECGRECHEIGEHMVAHVPDVTRLIDRLESAKLVTRSRCDKDRRVVRVTITRTGLALLSQLDQPVLDLHRGQLGHLTRKELGDLNQILVRARQFNESPVVNRRTKETSAVKRSRARDS